MPKRIKLTRGKYTLVDDDFAFLNDRSWFFDGHYAVYTDNKTMQKIYLHKIVMNATDKEQVDHINGNKLDNRKCNLRRCTGQQNALNKRPHKVSKTSKYKGVDFYDNKWRAQICVNKTKINLGNYKTEIEAAEAYDKAAEKYHGEFAWHNKSHLKTSIVNFNDFEILPRPKYKIIKKTWKVWCSNGKIYDTIEECARDLNVKPNTIVKACTDTKIVRRVRKFNVKYTEPAEYEVWVDLE